MPREVFEPMTYVISREFLTHLALWLFPANPPCPGRENAYVPSAAFLALWFPGAFTYGSGGKGINKRQGEGQKLGKGLSVLRFSSSSVITAWLLWAPERPQHLWGSPLPRRTSPCQEPHFPLISLGDKCSGYKCSILLLALLVSWGVSPYLCEYSLS